MPPALLSLFCLLQSLPIALASAPLPCAQSIYKQRRKHQKQKFFFLVNTDTYLLMPAYIIFCFLATGKFVINIIRTGWISGKVKHFYYTCCSVYCPGEKTVNELNTLLPPFSLCTLFSFHSYNDGSITCLSARESPPSLQ